MPTGIHFICKANAGLSCIDPKTGVYESESWLLTREEILALENGEVYFHETKMRPSYFGGTILGIRPAGDEAPETSARMRCVITLRSTAAARKAKWSSGGRVHAMAWTSGVVPVAPVVDLSGRSPSAL